MHMHMHIYTYIYMHGIRIPGIWYMTIRYRHAHVHTHAHTHTHTQVRIGPGGVRIKTMEVDEQGQFGEWIVMDDGKQSGGLWKVNWKDGMAATKLLDAHAGTGACSCSPACMHVSSTHPPLLAPTGSAVWLQILMMPPAHNTESMSLVCMLVAYGTCMHRHVARIN